MSNRNPPSGPKISWQAPVTTTAALPLVGNTAGDARVTLDTAVVWVWNGASWKEGGGAASWKDPVATMADLPLVGNAPGDARVALDSDKVWIWNGVTWVTNVGVLPPPTVPGDVLQLDALNTPVWGPVPVALVVTSFATGRGLFIAGEMSTNPATFTASYNQLPDSVTIHDDQGNPTLPFGVTPFAAGSYPFAYTKSVVANVVYTLTATRVPGGVATKTVSDGWGFQIYHGAAASVTTQADIHALPVNVVSQTKVVPNYPATSLGADYDWYCLPSSFGTPSFTDTTTGFPVDFIMTGSVLVTNGFGVTVSYDIWRSLNPGIGTAGTIVIHVS